MSQSDPTFDSQALAALMGMLPIGVAIAHDRDCGFITVNCAASRMLGIPLGTNASASADPNALPFKLIRDGRELAPEEMPMRVAARSGVHIREYEVDVVHPDGTRAHLLEYASPLRDASGEISGCIALFLDVTPHREAVRGRVLAEAETASRVRELSNSIEERVLSRTTEARDRAEELRTLALALADAEARERKIIAQSLHDQLQQVLSAAKLKAGLVRRVATDAAVPPALSPHLRQLELLIDRAIFECRALTLQLVPPVLFDGGLIPAIEAMARNVQQYEGLRVDVCCEACCEPVEEPLRVLLFEAVREMVVNAAKHARATRVTIRSTLAAPDVMQIVVSDDGVGFDLSSLTEPSKRVEVYRLGLAEVSERLRHIGGQISIQSAIGSGTTVKITAPGRLREPVGEPPEKVPDAVPRNPRTPPGPRRARVVVADDHAIFREGLIGLLKQENFLEIVGEAGDGELAVALSRKLQPDLLIVDISMPKLTGLQVTQILSRELPQTKIVGLSMHDSSSMDDAMRSAGAAAYLTKDNAADALVNVLRNVLCIPHA